MGKCRCGGKSTNQPIKEYVVPGGLLGLDRVVLVDGAVRADVCGKCGDITNVVIPDLPGLIAAAALSRVKMPFKLSGRDIKFLRKAMGMSAKDLGELLEVTQETMSRWENDKLPIGPTNEKLLRLIVVLKLESKAEAIDANKEQIATMKIQAAADAAERPVMHFVRVSLLVKPKANLEPVWRDEAVAA